MNLFKATTPESVVLDTDDTSADLAWQLDGS